MAKRFKPVTPLLPGFEPEGETRQEARAAAAGTSPATSRAAEDRAAMAAMLQPQDRPPGPPPESLAGQTVWVIDSHSLIHQVFHALPEMTSPRASRWRRSTVSPATCSICWRAKRPDFLFCAFDMPGKTFRHAMYAQYKAHRPAMPDDLAPQIISCHRMVRALGIPALGLASFEADDILATIARLVEQLDGRCFLVTGDKDCRQLISERVKLYNIRKNEVLDRDALRADWGISPQQVVDYLALVGDASDNVPGVPLVGPVYARQLLQKYGSLDEILKHADEVTAAARRENLKKYGQQAILSRRLLELDEHVPVTLDWRAARWDLSDPGPALALFEEFGFRSLAEKVRLRKRRRFDVRQQAPLTPGQLAEGAGGETGQPSPPTPLPQGERGVKAQHHLVDTAEKFAAFLAELRGQKCISVDTETTGEQPRWPRWAELVGMSVAWDDRGGWYLPFRTPPGENHLELQPTLEALRPVLEDPAVAKIGQNLKYDMIVLRKAGIALAGVRFDTHGRKLSAGRWAAEPQHQRPGQALPRPRDHQDRGTHRQRQEPEADGASAGGPGGRLCRRGRLAAGAPAADPGAKLAEEELDGLLADLELPLIDVLAEMEYTGIKVDVARLAELSRRFGERMAALEQEIYQLAGRRFNIASPKQLQQLLFVEKKLPVVKRTTTGPSTDVAVLEVLAARHPLPAKIVRVSAIRQAQGDVRGRPAGDGLSQRPAASMRRSTRWSRPPAG